MSQSADLCSYVSNRLLCYITCIPTRPNQVFERVFDDLIDFADMLLLGKDSQEVYRSIPEGRVSSDDLLNDVKETFSGVVNELGTIDSALAVRTLFVTTYIFMMKYRNDYKKCALFAFWLDVFSYRSSGWQRLMAEVTCSTNHALYGSRVARYARE